MDLDTAVEQLASEQTPCIAIVAQTGQIDGGFVSARVTVKSSIPTDDPVGMAHCLAALKHGYSILMQRFADSLGVPVNSVQSLVNEHVNRMESRERE